jgi:hypothetical protein
LGINIGERYRLSPLTRESAEIRSIGLLDDGSAMSSDPSVDSAAGNGRRDSRSRGHGMVDVDWGDFMTRLYGLGQEEGVNED